MTLAAQPMLVDSPAPGGIWRAAFGLQNRSMLSAKCCGGSTGFRVGSLPRPLMWKTPPPRVCGELPAEARKRFSGSLAGLEGPHVLRLLFRLAPSCTAGQSRCLSPK